MRHLFIINPVAGKKETTPALQAMLKELSFEHETVFTEGEGHAEQIAREAAESGEPIRIYACGGDGTLNEVVNGAAGYSHVAVTNVPKGTGNDFLKIFGENYRKQFYDIEALAVGPQTSFDLIDCNGKLGIDVVCAGVDARIGANVHHYKKWRFISGLGAYVLSLIENVLFKGICQPMSVKMGPVEWDNKKTAILCICNGRHYGGGFMPVGDAMPDDGVLDMLLVGKVSLFTFARLVGKYAKGLYRQFPELIKDYHGKSVSFSSPKGITVAVDGEVMRDTRFTVKLSDKRVNFFYPAGASYQVKCELPELQYEEAKEACLSKKAESRLS